MRLLVVLLFTLTPAITLAQGTQADYDRANGLSANFASKVFRDKITPNWFDKGTKFWYRVDLPQGQKEFVIVDAEKGTREVVTEDKLPKPEPKKPKEQEELVQFPRDGQSPDGKWTAFIKEYNVWLRENGTKEETKLSENGSASAPYERFSWSPDSKKFVTSQSQKGTERKITLVESSPRQQLQPYTQTLGYDKPGDEIRHPVLFLADTATKKLRKLVVEKYNPWEVSYQHWTDDSKRFLFLYVERGHQRVQILQADAETAAVSVLWDEAPKTFHDTAHKTYLQYLEGTKELIWMSERDGWNHLYLLDLTTGKVKNQITKGDWVVRMVDRVDVPNREIWFRAHGMNPGEDPYHIHHYRIKFDGTGLVKLTEGDGTHTIQYSPDRKYLIDTWSRVDLPPQSVLRKVEDGRKVVDLETADITELKKAGWRAPERFAAKGRDGKTDIYGVIVRPTNFDAKKQYRVIEHIYAGPHDFHVPKAYRPFFHNLNKIAELGFIVVMVDGMGTSWRSKAFHDVCWKNLGDSGLPDHIAWIKAAAEKHPEMDIANGVGIFGGSAGGQSSTRAMFAHPEFYCAAVSDCGCHDNRMDKVWWNEQWMGYPVGKHYAEQSNTNPEMVKKLKGKLMLVVGELDKNVDPASTMQVANALIKADKDFDLLVIPGAGHGACESPYGQRRRMDFFVKHMLGVEPRGK